MQRDPWSVVDESQPLIERLDLRARIDVAARVIEAEARLTLATPLPVEQVIALDARGLEVSAAGGLAFERDAPHPILGAPLRVRAPAGTDAITLTYRTTPDGLALDWREGFVYSQCQPIYARALVPLPDTPSRRIRYTAEVTAPDGLTVLMAARREGSRFVQDTPVPPYLLALVAAHVEARVLGPRTRVWAAPAQLDDAARAFADVERWIAAAEALFGPYPLDRFDLLVTPPSFPYGGMENPGLVFVHPSLLTDADDALRVVVHELSHAWVGNRVTAAHAEHLWLNEGWAVWAERRLVAVLAGDAAARVHEAAARRDLEAALRALAPARTTLLQALEGVPPEEAGSIVPYQKGRLFLARIEEAVGRARFDAFARAWVSRPRTVTTEDFLAFVDAELPGHGVDLATWAQAPGLPADAPAAEPAPAVQPIDLSDAAAIARAEAVVASSGRLQQVKPIWLALAQDPATKPTVGALFRRLRDRWHPIARESIELLLRSHGIATREVNPVGLGRRR